MDVDIIPLKPHTKQPIVDEWQFTSPEEQWALTQPGQTYNRAIRAGKSYVGIDCDNLQAVNYAEAILRSSGYPAIRVLSPSGGSHFWVKSGDVPTDFTYAHFAKRVGEGELRANRCYLVIPDSRFNGAPYQWEGRGLSDFPSLPLIPWIDLQSAFLPPYSPKTIELTSLPVRLLKREMPQSAHKRLSLLRNAPPGQPIATYRSRSDAEAAVIADLILAGWDTQEIFEAFERFRPTHFIEKGQRRAAYFRLTHQNVLMDIIHSKERLAIARVYQETEETGFTEIRELLDREVYRGILSTAWKFGSFAIGVSLRDLALYAHTDPTTARASCKRLIELYHRISPLGFDPTNQTLIYDTNPVNIPHKSQLGSSVKSSEVQPLFRGSMREVCNVVSKPRLSDTARELFTDRTGMLGRSAGAMYQQLLQTKEPITAAKLVILTGKTEKTVREALKRLLFHNLAAKVGSRWIKGPSVVEDVAENMGVEERILRRKNRIREEREAQDERRKMFAVQSRTKAWNHPNESVKDAPARSSFIKPNDLALTTDCRSEEQKNAFRKSGWTEDQINAYSFPMPEKDFGPLCDQAFRDWRKDQVAHSSDSEGS